MGGDPTSGQLPADAAAVEDEHSVAEMDVLGQLRRDEEHDAPLGGEASDDLVDLLLGAHIDTAGGVVEQHHSRVSFEPLGDDDLLLVAAGELVDR